MVFFLRWASCRVPGMCLLLLAACGGGGDGGSGAAGSPGVPGGSATDGALTLSVAGVPTDTAANISVAGPGGFSRAVSRSETLASLATGTYTVTADRVLNGTSLYRPTNPRQVVTVSAGASSAVTVAYGPAETLRLTVAPVASGLTDPIYLTAPTNDPRLFVVERAGRIRIVRDGSLLPTPYLDISALTSTDGERGLLSMAFDPVYASNGRFYVYYTAADGAITVSRFEVSSTNPDVADPGGTVLLTVPHPGASNHNGGQLVFGPDGMLYLAPGDGGGSNDPAGNAQNTASLLGKMLRIDVRGNGYAIPSDNPFATGSGGRPEIWAVGLRNPWRFSFDKTGQIYIADVGESAREEVNVVPATSGGLNYGWDRIEGTLCVGAATCDTTALTPPVFEYTHESGGCAILGGYVYRGAAVPEIQGRYFYTDLCTGRLQSFAFRDGVVTEVVDWSLPIPGTVYSFGTDAAQEIYVLTEGQVMQIRRAQ